MMNPKSTTQQTRVNTDVHHYLSEHMNDSMSELQETTEHGRIYRGFGSEFAGVLSSVDSTGRNALSRHREEHAAQDKDLVLPQALSGGEVGRFCR